MHYNSNAQIAVILVQQPQEFLMLKILASLLEPFVALFLGQKVLVWFYMNESVGKGGHTCLNTQKYHRMHFLPRVDETVWNLNPMQDERFGLPEGHQWQVTEVRHCLNQSPDVFLKPKPVAQSA